MPLALHYVKVRRRDSATQGGNSRRGAAGRSRYEVLSEVLLEVLVESGSGVRIERRSREERLPVWLEPPEREPEAVRRRVRLARERETDLVRETVLLA
jgi:hypothetical protein